MQHLTTETIMNYLDGRATERGRSTTEAHLSICRKCSDWKRQIEDLEFLLREHACLEPPAYFVEAWKNVFNTAREGKPGFLRRIILPLVFDSFTAPRPAGVRYPWRLPRHLIFTADDFDVDVMIEESEIKGQIIIVGQILSSSEDMFDNAPVRLESAGSARHETHTNVVGEFSFDVPNDTYDLTVELPQAQIAIPDVLRQKSEDARNS